MARAFMPYAGYLVERARELRNNPTPSERLLWGRLKGRQVEDTDFHRQKPLVCWIVDFYAPAIRLAVEVDGSSHDHQFDEDQIRQDILEDYGVSFLRFTNEQVLMDLDGVVASIATWIREDREKQRRFGL